MARSTRAKGIHLTDEMIARIQTAARRTWSYIQGDVSGDSISVADICELVIDADRMSSHGGDKEASKALYNLPAYTDMVKIVQLAFKN